MLHSLDWLPADSASVGQQDVGRQINTWSTMVLYHLVTRCIPCSDPRSYYESTHKSSRIVAYSWDILRAHYRSFEWILCSGADWSGKSVFFSMDHPPSTVAQRGDRKGLVNSLMCSSFEDEKIGLTPWQQIVFLLLPVSYPTTNIVLKRAPRSPHSRFFTPLQRRKKVQNGF